MSEQKVVGRNVDIALGIICIILAVSLMMVIFVSPSPTANSSVEQSNSTFKESPVWNGTISSMQDVENDMKGLDVRVVMVNSEYSTGLNFRSLNYTEFRRVAYNTKLVFLGDYYIYTVWNGVIIYYTWA